MTSHLTDAELRAFVGGGLPPERLLEADDHLVACDRCRTRAADLANLDARVHDLEIVTPSAHLDDEQIQRVAQRTLDAAEADAIRRHLDECRTCADQVRDLEQWAAPAPMRMPRWAAIAAAIIVAALVPVSIWQLRSRAALPTSIAGLDRLPVTEQQRVRAALASGTVESPPFMADLAPNRETLMGSPVAPTSGLEVVTPVGTAVAENRPQFVWTSAEDAGASGGYVVTIADDRSNVILRSPLVSTTSWTANEALPRGRTYTWQVALRRGVETVVAPAPPAPPARFHVVDEQTSALIAQVERDQPQAHLLLGILDANAGLRSEALRHLRQVAADDRYTDVARRLLDRLMR